MSNYRMWAYALIATGLLNWDYQRSHPHIVLHSLIIILPGVALLALTYFEGPAKKLERRPVQIFWAVVGVSALLYGFLN